MRENEGGEAAAEDVFRHANDALAATYRQVVPEGLAPTGLSPFICECSELRCTRIVQLTLEEYAAVRDGHGHFVVVPGHVVRGFHEVAEEKERYAVLVKNGTRELSNSY